MIKRISKRLADYSKTTESLQIGVSISRGIVVSQGAEAYRLLIQPKSKDKDKARREAILNVLLVGAIMVAVLAFLHNLILYYSNFSQSYAMPPFQTFFLLLSPIFLLMLSRKNKFTAAAYIFIGLIFLIPTYTVAKWGADVPQALLTFSMLIVIAGILINTRFAFLMTGLSGTILITSAILQKGHILAVNSSWKNQQSTVGDSILFATTLLIIAVVSWLFNRESEMALRRARVSEAALKRERDSLEVKVEERTKELKEAQMEKMAQLYRFAEIGRFTAGLFHDLVNPLNLVSLNLEKMSDNNRRGKEKELVNTKVLLERAIEGTKKLESFIVAARNQLQNQDMVQDFNLVDEIKEVIGAINYLAQKSHVKLVFKEPFFKAQLRGNPVLFYRLMTNLLMNSIESYDSEKKNSSREEVEISLLDHEDSLKLTIQDWGRGISKNNLEKVFEPFFSTKSHKFSLGIGLSICKEIVENSFKGGVNIESSVNKGTKVVVYFPKCSKYEGTKRR